MDSIIGSRINNNTPHAANPNPAGAPAGGPAEEIRPPDPVDAKGTVTMTSDKMRAFIKISMPLYGGRPLSEEDLRAVLGEKGIVYGIHELTLMRLVRSPLYDRDTVIAEGTPPQKGSDGAVEFHIKLQKDVAPRILEDGSVDYKDLGLVENVVRDQVLATRIPAEQGIDGKNVLGNTITAPNGKDKPLPIGKNTYVSDDGLELRAAKNGQSDYAAGKISVDETFTIRGDVSTATGDIDFLGNVTVNGSVLAGFTIKAGGNIDIHGHVEGSRIIAEGNVLIRDGFHGMYKGEIIAGGSVRSKYIQAGHVHAGGVVEAQVLLQANVQSSESVKLIGNRSTIVGGRTMARNMLDCYYIGGKNNPVPTIVEVGSDPHLFERRREIKDEMAALAKNIDDLERLLQLLRQLEAQNRLTQDKRDMMLRSSYTLRISGERLNALIAEDENMQFMLMSEGYGTVIARGMIFPGVRVVIGPEQRIVSTAVSGVMLVRGEDGIVENNAR